MKEEIIHGKKKRFITQEEYQALVDKYMRYCAINGLLEEDPREWLKRGGIEYWVINPDGSHPKEAYSAPIIGTAISAVPFANKGNSFGE